LLPLTSTDNAARCLELLAELLNSVVVSDQPISEDGIDKIPIAIPRTPAYVYIRQSSLHQVRHHQESRHRQYDLKQRAQQLGLPRSLSIDDDLGLSGSGSKNRPGFGGC
jgi:hypothetical protein